MLRERELAYELGEGWLGEVDRRSRSYVQWVQNSLNRLSGAGLAVDGQMGPRTRSAVISFQRQRGLSPDGVVGPATEAALIAAGASPSPGAGASPTVGPLPSGAVSGVAPGLIKRETQPSAYTLYADIALGSETPARPMTGIFIPENYRPQRQVDLILYLHGHNSPCGMASNASIDRYWTHSYFNLCEEVNASQKNVILVTPTLGPKSEAGRLVTRGGFDWYLDQVMAALRQYGPYQTARQVPTVGNIILACHSGGGTPMRQLALGRERYAFDIRECWGFDCLYPKNSYYLVKAWAQWASSHPNTRLYIHYLDSTEGNSRRLQSQNLPNVCVKRSTARNHCSVPQEHWQDRIRAARFLRNT